MDETRFDALTKDWTRLPRRRVLGGLVAGTLAPLLGLAGRVASAQTCRRSRQCGRGQTCVHHTCTAKCGDPLTCDSDGSNQTGGTGCPSTSCFCGKKPGGGSACLGSGIRCGTAQSCTSQRDCPQGQICATGCCDPEFVCQPPCVA